MNDRRADAFALAELSEGMKASVQFLVRREEMERFAELSGDFNPLHVDDKFARGKGFQGVVVYGALIVAKVSRLIGMRLPGRDALWASVSIDFVRPLYVDQPAWVEGAVAEVRESTGIVELKLRVRSESGQLLARGTAEVLLVKQ